VLTRGELDEQHHEILSRPAGSDHHA
jgi:hypothetical protein